jgi:adenosylhomocysteine nucleosidase
VGIGKIGIVFAIVEEKRGIETVLVESRVPGFSDGGITTYLTRGAEVMLLVAGVGRRCATAGTERLLDAGADLVISAGFAAGLDPCAGVGDVLVGSHTLLYGSDVDPIACSPRIRALLPPSRAFGFPIRLCNLVTGDRIVTTPREKGEIFSSTGAAVYDMESYAAAEVCARWGVPFAGIRVVSDTAAQRVPPVVEGLIESRGRCSRALRILGSPASWYGLHKLRKQAAVATDHLGDVLGTMLIRIP